MRDAAAYLRVSTPKQSEAMQRDAIEHAAAARRVQIVHWFHEKRARDARSHPELDAVRTLARRGKLAELWVFRLDRLGCGAKFMLDTVTELDAHGCRVVSAEEPIDTRGPLRDVVLAMLGWAAEMELEAIRERMAAARRKAERAGKRWGRPPEHDDADRIRLVELMYDGGLTLRKAAEKAGLSYGTAQRIMAGSQDGKKA